MSTSKLPPLKLDTSQTSIRSSNSSNQDGSVGAIQSARERRRMRRVLEEENGTIKQQMPRHNRRARSLPKQEAVNEVEEEETRIDRGKSNRAYVEEEDDDDDNNEELSKNRRKMQNETVANKPPKSKRRSKRGQQQNEFVSTVNMLEGLEEDVIEMDGYPANDTSKTSEEKNLSQRELLNSNNETSDEVNYQKSVHTDKFFLELEKKFEIQKKELYEKREQERLRAQFEWQLKQKQKEEQKYQISTPKYAVKTHSFLRTVFLFFHGVNVGYQFWLLIVIFLSNFNAFTTISNLNNGLDLSALPKVLLFFENLTMPIHCISYFFLTICIVDSMDRVDLTKMSLKYFVKCLAFQNQFWAIVAYLVALVVSLVLINVDQTVYSLSQLRSKWNVSDEINSQISYTINSNVDLWRYLNLVKAVFSVLGWFLFTILINHDKTYESLKNRDFSILDEFVTVDDKNNQQKILDQKQSKA